MPVLYTPHPSLPPSSRAVEETQAPVTPQREGGRVEVVLLQLHVLPVPAPYVGWGGRERGSDGGNKGREEGRQERGKEGEVLANRGLGRTIITLGQCTPYHP